MLIKLALSINLIARTFSKLKSMNVGFKILTGSEKKNYLRKHKICTK